MIILVTLHLNNVTEATIVAYYLYSSFEVKGRQKYTMRPSEGFIKPGEIKCITVMRHFIDENKFQQLEQCEDLVFLKALPLNENIVTEHNLTSFVDNIEDKIFNDFNIDLMFNLEVLTVQFQREPVDKPDYQELALQVEIPKNKVSEYNLVDEEDQEQVETVRTLQKNHVTKAGSSSQVGEISYRDEEADDESQNINGDKSSPQSSAHNVFEEEKVVQKIPRQNSFVDDRPVSHTSSKREKVKDYQPINENDQITKEDYGKKLGAAVQLKNLAKNEDHRTGKQILFLQIFDMKLQL